MHAVGEHIAVIGSDKSLRAFDKFKDRQCRSFLLVREKSKVKVLGVGLDAQDEQVRVTRGKNFHLVGGSKNTHESMQEKCIKMNEKLDAKGKELEDLEHQEFLDLAAQVGINVVKSPTRGPSR
jgi:hypothetical protein